MISQPNNIPDSQLVIIDEEVYIIDLFLIIILLQQVNCCPMEGPCNAHVEILTLCLEDEEVQLHIIIYLILYLFPLRMMQIRKPIIHVFHLPGE